jgi:hypothetical protein
MKRSTPNWKLKRDYNKGLGKNSLSANFEIGPYFKIGISDDYILLRDDFPVESVSPGDFKKLLVAMFKKNDEVRRHGK